MRFTILKSSFDGISGGGQSYDSIDEVLREVSYHKGWDSREQLHGAIRKWAKQAQPGSVFMTQVTAIVAVGVGRGVHADDICTECGHEEMDYGEFDGVESGDIEQEVICPECGSRWKDVFMMAERRSIGKKRRA